MINTGLPALLTAFSFIFTTNLSTLYLAIFSARCRRLSKQCGDLHRPRCATSSSPRSQNPPYNHASSRRPTITTSASVAMIARLTGGAHARPRRQRWGQLKQRRTEPAQFVVLERTRCCCGVSSWPGAPSGVRSPDLSRAKRTFRLRHSTHCKFDINATLSPPSRPIAFANKTNVAVTAT